MKPRLLFFVVCLTLALSGCYGATRDAATKYAAIYRADSLRQDSEITPDRFREIARDAADAFEVQAWRLGGPKPGADVLARLGIVE